MINAVALAQARTQRGLSQRKLAQLVGLNFQVIRRLEAGGSDGNLTLRDLDKICSTLAVAPTTLLTRLAAGVEPSHRCHDIGELDLSQARLLRRIQREPDVRRSLTSDERQLVLPTLIRLGLVHVGRGAPRLGKETGRDLALPEELPPA